MHARILVVEDDYLQRSVMQAALEASGFEVETASDGLSAVWKIREGHYDLVILGYKLPEIDGLAVARLIGDIMSEAVRPQLFALTASPEGILAREFVGGKAFDKVIEKRADLPLLLASITSSLRPERDQASQNAAEIDQFLTAWDEYDAVPDRPQNTIRGIPSARVLVVEDDELQRSILKAVLTAEGYSVEASADGLDAVRMIRAGGFDLALIDYELPEIDGFAVADLIGNLMGEGVRPRLVALTASPDVLRSRVEHSHQVFDEVVGKQEPLPALVSIVKHHLKPLFDRGVRRDGERVRLPACLPGQPFGLRNGTLYGPIPEEFRRGERREYGAKRPWVVGLPQRMQCHVLRSGEISSANAPLVAQGTRPA